MDFPVRCVNVRLPEDNTYTGWWLSPTRKMMEFVSWDDEIPNIWKKTMFQTTNQFLLGRE